MVRKTGLVFISHNSLASLIKPFLQNIKVDIMTAELKAEFTMQMPSK